MHLRGLLAAACVLSCFLFGPGAIAQTTVSPEVSIVGDFRGKLADRPEDFGLAQKRILELHSVEVAVTGDLGKYAHARVFIAWHGDESELEEAVVEFEHGLPWNLSLQAGRYLGNFGQLNLRHPHTYSFINRPLVHGEYLGSHGFTDDGISLRWSPPPGSLQAEISADLLRGGAFVGHCHELGDDIESAPDLGFLSHLLLAAATGERSQTTGGLSLAYGHYDPVEDLASLLLGADFRHDYHPVDRAALSFQAEALLNRRETGSGDHPASGNAKTNQATQEGEEPYEEFFGAFAVVDCFFDHRFNLGARFDYYQPLEDKDNDVKQIQLFAGFAPVEGATTLRLAGYYRKPAKGDGGFGGVLQLMFALGSHGSHH